MHLPDPRPAHTAGKFQLEGDAAYSCGDPEEGWERLPLSTAGGSTEASAGLKAMQKACYDRIVACCKEGVRSMQDELLGTTTTASTLYLPHPALHPPNAALMLYD